MDDAFAGGGSDQVFDQAADLFGLLSTPTRLRIVCELRGGETKVGELRRRLPVGQPNLSQHLNVLYRAGIVGRRRAGSQVFYRIVSERARLLCDSVCELPAPRRTTQRRAGAGVAG
jgi:ArsR family transcriptional regulator